MKNLALGLAIFAALGIADAAAQMGGPSISGPSNYNPSATQPDQGRNLMQEDSDRMFLEAITAQRKAMGKKESKDDMLKNAAAAAKELGLACTVSDAEAVSTNKVTTQDGKVVHAETYEIACSEGLGYFVVAQTPIAPVGYSCFRIQGQHEAAVAKGEKFDEACVLPANQNLKGMAQNLIARNGATCSVSKIEWSGDNAAAGSEYTEAACADGKGYMIATPLPGNTAALAVKTCPDSAQAGLPCQLSSNGATATASLANTYSNGKPTFDTFKAYIAAKGIKCSATAVRSIGKENVHKRHVVEFQCPEYPKGLVAFIPLDDSTAPFQTLDCDAAKKAGAVCKLDQRLAQ
jgi:hypothetical protein